VAFVLADSATLLEIMHGALWAGLTVVPLNARLLEDHLYMVGDAAVRATCGVHDDQGAAGRPQAAQHLAH
jgi:hypothetical protein